MNSSAGCEYPDRISGGWLYVLTSFGMFISIVNVVGNGIILVAYMVTKRLQKTSYLLLTNLAISDMLYGLTFPMYVSTDFNNDLYCNAIFGYFRIGCIYLAINMQLNNLAIIAMERFLGIQFPYFYRAHVTKDRTFNAAGVVWVVGILRATYAAMFYKTQRRIVLVVELPIVAFLIVFNLVVYCRIYTVSKRHLKKDRAFGIGKQESKSLVAVQIALFNLLFWLPTILVRTIEYMLVETKYWLQVTFLMPFVGSCFNLVIYTYRMAEYRIAVKRLTRRHDTVGPLFVVSID